MKYREDLDGLRGIAVLLVIATHAYFPVTNDGGTTGVTAFFVLSGYLITRLLVQERELTGRIDLRAFYLRRALRLGPALLVLLAFVLAVGVWVGWAGGWQVGTVASLFYVSNWVQVAGIQVIPLGHTWTLAIEEQFYLIWPVVLMLVRPRWALRIAIAGAMVGTLAHLIATGTFEYFSTITRGNAILVGCVLGLVQVRLPSRIGALGVPILVILTYMNLPHDVANPIAILASSMIICSSLPALGVLAPIGRRAYGLYLWNYPLSVLLGPVAALWTFPVAMLSYRLVERPLMRRFGPGLKRGVPKGDPGGSPDINGTPASRRLPEASSLALMDRGVREPEETLARI